MLNFLLNLLPNVAGILLGVCYIPQIVKTYKTKNVSSMSLSFWAILNVALTLLVANAVVVFLTKGVWGLVIMESFNELLALVMLILVTKYRHYVPVQPKPPAPNKIGFTIETKNTETTENK